MTDVKKKIWGDKAEAVEASLRTLNTDLADLIVNVAYDNVFARDGLELKTKELLAIAHLVGLGSEDELTTHIYGALNCGATLGEIKETLLHAAMFVGFPKTVRAMRVFQSVQTKLESKQIR